MKTNFIFLAVTTLEDKELAQFVITMIVFGIGLCLLIIAIIYLLTLIGTLIKSIKKLFKIWEFKKNGFSYKKRLILPDGKILLYGLELKIEKIRNYFSVIIIDKNFNILDSKIFGIGDDIEYNDELIRILEISDQNFRIGFINKKTGIIKIDYQFEKAHPFYRYCDIRCGRGYEKIYSKVYYPGKINPNYIDTKGKLIKDKKFFGCPQLI